MLYLVRHGQTPYNAEGRLQGQLDIPLSEKGREQAHALGKRLKAEGAGFDALYCSTLQRAGETARIVGGYLGLMPKPIPGVEEIDFGSFQSHTFSECERLFPEAYADFLKKGSDSNAHGGETGRMVFERARRAVLSVPEAENGSALIVCHGAVIGFIRAYAAGAPFTNVSDYIPDNAEIIALESRDVEKLKAY